MGNLIKAKILDPFKLDLKCITRNTLLLLNQDHNADEGQLRHEKNQDYIHNSPEQVQNRVKDGDLPRMVLFEPVE